MSFNTYKNIKNEINKYNNFILTTCVDSIPAATESVYINDGFDLYCYLHSDSRNVKQLEYNSRVEAVIYSGGNAHQQGLLVEGKAYIINDYDDEKQIRDKFLEKFRSMRAFIKSEDSTLVKIRPLEIKRIYNKKLADDQVLKFRENTKSALGNIFGAIGRWFKKWISAARLSFLSTTLGALLIGISAAIFANDAQVFNNWEYIIWACLGAFMAHASTNLFNDYYDHKNGNDSINSRPTSFSGGSRMIQSGILSAEKVLSAAWIFFLGALAIGLYLNFNIEDNWLLLIGGIGLLLVYFYSAPPLKLIDRGLGEIAVGLSFGPLIVLGIFYVMTEELAWLPLIVSVPPGLLVFLIIFINEFQDEQYDRESGKRNLVVRIEDKLKAIRVYNYLMIVPYLWIIGFVVGGFLPYYALIVLLLVPLSWKAVSNAVENYDRVYELLQTNGLTVAIHLLFSVLLSIGLLVKSLIN